MHSFFATLNIEELSWNHPPFLCTQEVHDFRNCQLSKEYKQRTRVQSALGKGRNPNLDWTGRSTHLELKQMNHHHIPWGRVLWKGGYALQLLRLDARSRQSQCSQRLNSWKTALVASCALGYSGWSDKRLQAGSLRCLFPVLWMEHLGARANWTWLASSCPSAGLSVSFHKWGLYLRCCWICLLFPPLFLQSQFSTHTHTLHKYPFPDDSVLLTEELHPYAEISGYGSQARAKGGS